MATDYNAINFKNKDVDKFATKFNKDKEPKTTTESHKNIFGRTTTYTQTGRDNNNDFTEKVTDRKGRLRKEISGTYKEQGDGDILKDNSVMKKYDKAGNVKKEDTYTYSSPGTKNEDYKFSHEIKKKGKVVRSKSGVYQETNHGTTDMGVKVNRKGKVTTYDRNTTNFNELPLRRRR